MSHLPPLLSDLALLLLLAAAATLIFKKLKQPLVLGYIVAGFLANGTITFFPSISDSGTISIWAEIGIIFLLFSLGLEFSFKKLFKIGNTALITASLVVAGMMSMGFVVGKMMGWNTIDSVFLGAMLSMSSTTIIIKAFDDLGITRQRFTNIVFGVLIVEDLFAILLLVILSTLGSSWDSTQLLSNAFNLVFFILLWFLGGMLLIPLALKKIKNIINQEMLLILSLGLCMGMVVFANAVGFSSALGAFVMGSILAETIEAEQIERLTKPVKHLFGSIFFVSVGMMIRPEMITTQWAPILIITGIVIVGQIIFSTTGILLSGQPLKTAVQSGFSLAQIGEFAFIIASLGTTMGLTSPTLYPIAASVSIITTFATPFFIRKAEPFYIWLNNKLSPKTHALLDRISHHHQTATSKSTWKTYRQRFWIFVLIQAILAIGIIMLSKRYLLPSLQNIIDGYTANIVTTIITSILIAPLLWSLVFKRIDRSSYNDLWNDSRFNHGILIFTRLLRIIIAILILAFLFTTILRTKHGLIMVCAFTIISLVLFNKRLRQTIEDMEKQLKINLGAREKHSRGNIQQLVNEIQMASFVVSPNSQLVGRYLYKANFRANHGVSIVCIKRGDQTLFIPGARDQIFPYDCITIVGDDASLIEFGKLIEINQLGGEWMEVSAQTDIELSPILLTDNSTICHHTLRELNLREKALIMIVGIERNNEKAFFPDADSILLPSDLIWVVGHNQEIKAFESICQSSSNQMDI